MTQMKQDPKPVDFSKLEPWALEPWKEVGLTQEQWTRPLSELSEEHRKVIFDVYNTKFNVSLKPQDFNLKK